MLKIRCPKTIDKKIGKTIGNTLNMDPARPQNSEQKESKSNQNNQNPAPGESRAGQVSLSRASFDCF